MSESGPAPKKRNGEILKEERIKKGLSLEAVHEATKIPMDVLKAIEEGYEVRTLSSFYMKAFQKKYADYLDVSVKASEEEFAEKPREMIKSPAVDENIKIQWKERPPFPHRGTILKAIVALVVLFFTIRIFGCITAGRKTERKVSKSTVKQVKEQPAAKSEAEVKPEVPAAPPQEKKKTAPAKQPVKPEIRKAVETPAQNSAAEAPPEEPKKNTKKINLTVRAAKKSWLQVKVDGNLVFQSTLQEGIFETWQANKEIEISGRNISHLDFELNGNILGTLGRADRKARRVVITEDGLTVKR